MSVKSGKLFWVQQSLEKVSSLKVKEVQHQILAFQKLFIEGQFKGVSVFFIVIPDILFYGFTLVNANDMKHGFW